MKNFQTKRQIGVLYHSPRANKSEFLIYLKSTVETYFKGCNNNIIIGNFNDHELTHLNRKKYELLHIDKRTGEWTECNVTKKGNKKN